MSVRLNEPAAFRSVLHGVIRDHLDDFLRAAADRADGAGLPGFIARAFRELLICGVPAHGFARVSCEQDTRLGIDAIGIRLGRTIPAYLRDRVDDRERLYDVLRDVLGTPTERAAVEAAGRRPVHEHTG